MYEESVRSSHLWKNDWRLKVVGMFLFIFLSQPKDSFEGIFFNWECITFSNKKRLGKIQPIALNQLK